MTRNWIDGHTSLTFSSSALSPNLATMFILYGIVGGIGCGLMFLPTGTTCNYWFKKRRAIANGKYYHKSLFCGLRLTQDIHRLDKLFFRAWPKLEGQNVRNFTYPVRIRWSRQPNLVPFYLYNRIFECPENIRNDGFPDVCWSSIPSIDYLCLCLSKRGKRLLRASQCCEMPKGRSVQSHFTQNVCADTAWHLVIPHLISISKSCNFAIF